MIAPRLTQSKTEIRKNLRELLRTGPQAEERENQTRAVNSRLIDLLKNASGTWAAFQPIDPEPDIRPALDRLKNINWVFPRVSCEYLSFYRVERDSQMAAGSFGILEPALDAEEVATSDISGFLVPGLAFDRVGSRLGRGRGFYDRTLFGVKAVKVGIAFDRQIMNQSLPVEEHDIAMDIVVTAGELIKNPHGDPSSKGILK